MRMQVNSVTESDIPLAVYIAIQIDTKLFCE